MCSKCDEIRCLRDSCPGSGCRLCGYFSSDVYHEHYFLQPLTPTNFSKIPPKRHRRSWLLASKSVWKSDFLCIALWYVALLCVSQASAEQYHTQIVSFPPTITTTPTTNNSAVHLSEGRSKYNA